MECAGLELRAEEQLPLVEVAKELERVGVLGILPEDRPGLQHKLVGAKVVALEKDELVLVGEVQWPHDILQDAEVEGLDALRARVRTIIAHGQQLGTAEADLAIEDGVVADENLGWLGLAVKVKLERR